MRFALVCSLTLSCLALNARADDSAATARYELIAYIWGTSLAQKIDTDEGEVSTHISFSQLFEHLSGALQVHGRGEWGPWSLDVDAMYAKLRGENQSKTVRLGPQGGIRVGAEVKSRLDEWIVEVTGGRRVFEAGSLFSRRPTDSRRVRGEVYLGARYWSIDPKITVQVNATRFRIGDRTEWVDPLVGLRFGIDLSSTVMMLVGGDVGGFNVGNYSSEFAWAQLTSLSWRVSDSMKLYVGYKFLDVHQNSGDLDTRMQTRGPFIAAGYVF